MRPAMLDRNSSRPRPRAHPWQDRLRHPQGTDRVDVQQPRERLRRCRLHGGDEDLPGVGDQNVDLPGLPDRRGDAVGVGDVEREPLVRGQAGERARVPRGGDHPVAAAGELRRRRAADALGRSGDQYRCHDGLLGPETWQV